MSFFSTTLTTTAAIQNLMQNKLNIKKCPQISISVRSLGTATYVALGGLDSQDRQLTAVGQGIGISAEHKPDKIDYYFDPTTIFVISDAAGAVIEIFGESI
jgi:hypothetical protein